MVQFWLRKYLNQMNKENLLVPRNLEGRLDKLKQMNYKLLQQEIIEGYLSIDESFEFTFDNISIKTKEINGDVRIRLQHIPEWFQNIKINGYFNCSFCNLTSLKGCPKYIKDFDCSWNKLNSLEFCPEYVGNDFYCYFNKTKFTKEYVRSLCEVKGNIYVKPIL